mmetsp:Transcript_18552/g.42965  ORF Transcript_18552/g.42965 Transcript_18552/m.42965 type:complete len:109 (+) Transcript_18552:1748-2074(+)
MAGLVSLVGGRQQRHGHDEHPLHHTGSFGGEYAAFAQKSSEEANKREAKKAGEAKYDPAASQKSPKGSRQPPEWAEKPKHSSCRAKAQAPPQQKVAIKPKTRSTLHRT